MPPTKKRRALRCTFRENGRRCPRDGEGNPPLCRAHHILLAEQMGAVPTQVGQSPLGDTIGRIMAGKRVSTDEVIKSAFSFLGSMFGGAPPPQQPPMGVFEQYYEHAKRQQERQAQQQREQRRAQPPKPPSIDDEIARARKVLGFKAGEKVTADEIKRRQRKLALKYHPDRVGSVVKMAAVNAAADVLAGSISA